MMMMFAFDGRLGRFDKPIPRSKEVLIKISRAGICGTDLEMLQGYKKDEQVTSSLILGHEFVGVVEDDPSEDKEWVGQRVVGEINLPCNECSICTIPRDNQIKRNHCPNRNCVGILKHNGAFAEYMTLPIANLYKVPDCITDSVAVFVEPVAAAFRIIETQEVDKVATVGILGDGKLGCITAHVLSDYCDDLTVIGKHPHKLAKLAKSVSKTILSSADINCVFDVVVECTGSPSGFDLATRLTKPMGKIILKSTCSGACSVNNTEAMNAVVVKELKVVGSRCGPFEMAIKWLEGKEKEMKALIQEEFSLSRIEQAIEAAKSPGALKIQIVM